VNAGQEHLVRAAAPKGVFDEGYDLSLIHLLKYTFFQVFTEEILSTLFQV